MAIILSVIAQYIRLTFMAYWLQVLQVKYTLSYRAQKEIHTNIYHLFKTLKAIDNFPSSEINNLSICITIAIPPGVYINVLQI